MSTLHGTTPRPATRHGPSGPRFRPLPALVATLVLAGAGASCPLVAASDEVPSHPDGLRYDPLEFSPPDRAAHRARLESGPVVYVVEDDSLPLVDIRVLIRAGTWLEPAAKAGLAGAVGSQLRAGGTSRHTPEEFDEEVDFLAAQLSTSLGDTQGSASLNCLTKDLDRVLELFFVMLRHPRFDEGRLELWRKQQLQAIERRNDSTGSIEGREWNRLLRGGSHFTSDHVTRDTLESIDRDDLLSFHRSYIHPANFVIAVSGDVRREKILASLQERLAGWKTPRIAQPPIPSPTETPRPGLYMVDKPDVNQGRVVLGHLGLRRDHPDYHAVLVMNHILGGGGFVSRITSRVRSDEGLAYTARSQYDFGVWYDGSFRAWFQSRSESVARAARIVIEEIERIRGEAPSAEEVDAAINYFRGVFPRSFATPAQVASTFAADELTGRPESFWTEFRDRIAAVTPETVRRAAHEHLHPDRLVILIVGNVEAITAGDKDHPDVKVATLPGGADVREIPLPDPLTLVYPDGSRGSRGPEALNDATR